MSSQIGNRNVQARTYDKGAWTLYVALSLLGILLVPQALTFYDYPFLQSLWAIILLVVCFYPTARFYRRKESGLPAFPMLCLAYAVQFSVPALTRDNVILLSDGPKYLAEEDVLWALSIATCGMVAIQCGYYLLKRRRVEDAVPSIDLRLNQKKAVVYCIAVGVLMPLIINLQGVFAESVSQQLSAIQTLLQTQVLVAIGLLSWIVYSGRGKKWHRFLLYYVVGSAVLRGIATAFLEPAVVPMAVVLVVKWQYTRHFSWAGITAVALMILFFSPVKGDFRNLILSGSAGPEEALGTQGRITLWVEQATNYWADTLSGEKGMVEATSDATSRTDFIHQFAHVCSLTPSAIPYQYGETYSYFAVALIPRVLWPEKPTAGSANNFYAVAYGVTTEEGARRSTFGMSLLAEGYINFGVAGVIFIMALQGLILVVLQYVFAGERAGPGGQAIFLAFFVSFLNGIGSSAEILFGNLIQLLLVSTLLLMWAKEREKFSKDKLLGISVGDAG